MTKSESWIRITETENIPPREARAVSVGGNDIAICNVGGRFLAIENRCPHGGGPLADGIIGGSSITCPLHNWRVCLESGGVTKPSTGAGACVKTYPVKVEGGIVMLSLV